MSVTVQLNVYWDLSDIFKAIWPHREMGVNRWQKKKKIQTTTTTPNNKQAKKTTKKETKQWSFMRNGSKEKQILSEMCSIEGMIE